MPTTSNKLAHNIKGRKAAEEEAEVFIEMLSSTGLGITRKYGAKSGGLFFDLVKKAVEGIRPSKPAETPPSKPHRDLAKNQRSGGGGKVVRALIEGVVVKETAAAFAVSPDDGSQTVWFPKSQLAECLSEGETVSYVLIPEWLANEKSLSYEDDWV